jgi:nitrite reductase/ring-hydroxylating ferredoxin subunit/uncharacterized membrane protein
VPERLSDRVIRRQNWLDPLAEFLQKFVAGGYKLLGAPGRALRNLLHGTKPFHHPLHPAVTDIPIGAWGAGVVLDYVAQLGHKLSPEGGDIALGVGLVAALLAIASGYTDFSETFGQERRVAVVHGLFMTVAFLIEVASLALRLWAGSGTHPLAVYLSTLGFALVLTGGFFGGHLVFGNATMVNRNAFLHGKSKPVEVGKPEDFPEGKLCRVMAGDMPVLVVRRQGTLCAISAFCSHAGGPLDEGTLEGDVVVCPWHQSRFDIRTGKALGGPATFAQPVLDVAEKDGAITVKLQNPLH